MEYLIYLNGGIVTFTQATDLWVTIPPLPIITEQQLVKQSCHLVEERYHYKSWTIPLGSHTRPNLLIS